MSVLLEVTLPVFLVIAAGYVAVWAKVFSDDNVDALMRFTQNFAIPCLLFAAISTLDLKAVFDWRLLTSYYAGVLCAFGIGILGAKLVFGRPIQDAIAIGFCCMFANTVLLGLPIMERAHGVAALEPMFAIISIHAPFVYMVGITTMEIVRASSKGLFKTIWSIAKTMSQNALMIAVALGFTVNLSGLMTPVVVEEAVSLIARAGLPAALFGLGGVLYRYKPEGNLREVIFVCLVSLMVHPSITWALGRGAFDLSDPMLRAAALTAAMAPGVNTYIFANMYGVAKRVVATAVLAGTAVSILSAAFWLSVLP
ncbi:AEC family transporter [Dinoroseobacter sp. S76]|uniref:AEC family transporter n=1 Tax=Dinoroseobacter sp. S76 TaxID=3415124 RepID=UPI003C7EAE2D